MDRVSVTSSNVVSVGYYESTLTLEVEFTGGAVYQYSGVPPDAHAGLMAADSPGKYLFAKIKGTYSYKRV